MARLVFPDDRFVYTILAGDRSLRAVPASTATVYSDVGATTLANISLTSGGSPISGSTLTLDAYSQVPLFYGPSDGTDTLYVVVNGGPVSAIYARADDRIDANATAIATEATRATTAEATKSPALTPVAVKTSAYNIGANEFVPFDTTSGSIVATLPAGPADGTRVGLKHVILGGTNTVTVNCGGSDVFNKAGGATSLTLTLLAQAVSLQYKAAGAIWYVVGDDLPLSQLDLRFAPSGSATDAVFYVSKSAKASDSNDGTLPGSAVATISRALTLLGSSPGKIVLMYGTHTAPTGGISLVTKQALVGCGLGSIISGTGVTAGYVARLTASRSEFRDFWVTNVPAAATAVRVTATGSNQVSRCDRLFVDGMGNGAVAYGCGDDTALDVSETMFFQCASVGNGSDTTWHMAVGNGGTGNVIDNQVVGGNAAGHQYGLVINGGGVQVTGLDFETSSTADIWFKQVSSSPCAVRGSRSENALQFIKCTWGSSIYNGAVVEDCTAVNLTNTDGKAITTQTGALRLSNIVLRGLNCPQFIYSSTVSADTTAGTAFIDCDGVASEHPYPYGGSPWSRRGKRFRVANPRFLGDAQGQAWDERERYESPSRRFVANGSAYTINPRLYPHAQVQLVASAGTPTLLAGTHGQEFTLAFIQDGTGSWTYTWPANCGFDGSAPTAITTARHRQSVTFRWTGNYWLEVRRVTDGTPPSPVTNAITETFASGSPFWLGAPSGGGTSDWQHVPGGGSLGISGGHCVTNCLGWFGDVQTTDSGLFTSGAAAVIETGMATMATGISATFTWQAGEGIVFHYLDDMTFMVAICTATTLNVRAFKGGVASNYGNVSLGVTLVAGASHTLLIIPTSTGFTAKLDGTTISTRTWLTGDQAAFSDLTKHGIVSASRSATFTAFSAAA